MLGIKIGLLLVLAVCSSSLISESFATSIQVEFDKYEYQTGEDLILSGSIEDFSMPIVALSIFDPDGKILSANNLELDEDGNFSKIISLDSPFYDLPGIYIVKIDYQKISLEEFFIISGEPLLPEPIEEQIKPEVVLLATEKDVYTDGDTIEITGIVSTIESPSVLIGIYDPFGTPAGFYFGTVDDTLLFSTSFLAKAGVNFKIDGIYTVKAHYAESELTTNFEFYQNISNPLDDLDSSDNNTQPSDNNTQPSDNNTQPSDNKEKPSKNETVPIIQNKPKDPQNNEQKDDSKTETTKTKESGSADKSVSDQGNLTVEDIELGKLLNQINLECDRSKYVDTISYYDGMGPALYRLCKFESSLEFFDQTLSKDPTNIEALVNKGSALRKLGYSIEAVNYFDKALKIDSNFVPALNNKANTLAIQGKYDEAVGLYAQALGKNPGYNTARQNMELVLSEMPVKTPTIPKPTFPVVDNRIYDESISTFEPTWISQPSNTQKEKTPDFFEQIGSVFSSLGSILGISN